MQGDSIVLGKMENRILKKVLKISNLKKTVRYLQKNGLKYAYYAAKERIEEEKQTDYSYQKPDAGTLARQREEAKKFPYLLSLVVPTYETKEVFLREMIESVLAQSYENWELILADASSSDKVKEIAEEYRLKEQGKNRIQYIRLPENKGISENTNVGIEAATGDYIGLLDHDDFLTPDALYEIAKAVAEGGKAGKLPIMLYSDEDKYENNACIFMQPNIKYKFNLDLILSNNYICHLLFLKSDRIKSLKLRKEYDGAQDYDLVLRTVGELLQSTEAVKLPEKIYHIPKVLYHWRSHEDSTAENTASKTYAYEAGKAALEDFCRQRGWHVTVTHARHLGFYEISYQPDIFAQRAEVGVVGGRILNKQNKITSGIYDENGEKMYVGIHKEYSGGSTHRAVLQQDCLAVDIRCMRVCPALQPVFEQICGIPYVETTAKTAATTAKTESTIMSTTQKNWADVSGISCDEEGYRKLSLEFGKAVREKGYLSVWQPR